LNSIGLDFHVCPVSVDETLRDGETDKEYALRLARAKAVASREVHPDNIHIGCDTVVVLDGRILGKPRDDTDAVRMLRLLSGRTHRVVTAVALAGTEVVSDFCETEVSFDPIDEEMIRWYVDTSEPMDKAGAYGIQGRAAIFVSRISGSYSNVVGLPVNLLAKLFSLLGYELADLLDRR